jgi:hypothetical protein
MRGPRPESTRLTSAQHRRQIRIAFFHRAAIRGLVIAAASLPSHAEPFGDPEGWEAVPCTVSGGANNRKSGLITVENGDDGISNVYCEGSWGATECSGNNKCVTNSVVRAVGGGRVIAKPIVSVPSTTLNVNHVPTLAR